MGYFLATQPPHATAPCVESDAFVPGCIQVPVGPHRRAGPGVFQPGSRADPLPLERLPERFVPERTFRCSKTQSSSKQCWPRQPPIPDRTEPA
jgi:hypothetical protein